MSDALHPVNPEHEEPLDSGFDTEIDARSFGILGIWLAVAMAITVALMYWMFRDLEKREIAHDAPASPLVDRSQPNLPPNPRLQPSPNHDLQFYLDEQQQMIDGYGWVDEARGIVHVPVERAMDLLLERGLPARPATPQAMGSMAPSAPQPAATETAPANTPPAHEAGGHP